MALLSSIIKCTEAGREVSHGAVVSPRGKTVGWEQQAAN